jgi:nitrate/nitrite-specific signal transduction histidine kinase
LFHQVLKSSRTISEEVGTLMEHQEKIERQLEQLSEEKRRLEMSYASGILFSSETEMKALMEKAIDTVMKELDADAGFIVLVNETGISDTVFTRNVDLNAEPDAREVSTTVIRTTIAQSKPTQLEIQP